MRKSDISSYNRARRRFRRNNFFFPLFSFFFGGGRVLISRLFAYLSRVKRPSFTSSFTQVRFAAPSVPNKTCNGSGLPGGRPSLTVVWTTRWQGESAYNKNNNNNYYYTSITKENEMPYKPRPPSFLFNPHMKKKSFGPALLIVNYSAVCLFLSSDIPPRRWNIQFPSLRYFQYI